jgi:S-adenosylmethionine synthetase
MAAASIDGLERDVYDQYDLTPTGIIRWLELDRPVYDRTAIWGHFGRCFTWDK